MAACEWLKNNTDITDTWHIDITRYDCPNGISMTPCDVINETTTAIILLSLGGVATLLIIIIIIYKIIVFCKEFQDKFGGNVHDSEMLKQEKRRLIISIFADFYAFVLGAFDAGTDITAAVMIVNEYKKNNYQHSKPFVMCYFTLAVIILFVSVIQIFITWKNIFIAYNELKRGVLLKDIQYNEIRGDNNDDNEIGQTVRELEFKKQILSRKIQHQSVTIFVAICEDLPFLVLNLYGILHKSTNNVDLNVYLMGSLVVNCLSLGYKMCVFKEFFGNLQERNSLNQMIVKFNSKSNLQLSNINEVCSNNDAVIIKQIIQDHEKQIRFLSKELNMLQSYYCNENINMITMNYFNEEVDSNNEDEHRDPSPGLTQRDEINDSCRDRTENSKINNKIKDGNCVIL
eukprot:55872_1